MVEPLVAKLESVTRLTPRIENMRMILVAVALVAREHRSAEKRWSKNLQYPDKEDQE